MMIKSKLLLYDQELEPKEILTFLAEDLKNRLTAREREQIKKAFYLAVEEYKNRYEEKYLNKMLI